MTCHQRWTVPAVSVALLVVAGTLHAAPDLVVTTTPAGESDLTLSRRIPIRGERIELRARIRNDGDEPATDVPIDLTLTDRDGKELTTHRAMIDVKAADSTSIAVEWTPEANGFYRFSVMIDAEEQIAESDEKNNTASWEFPVVFRRLYFNKWGADIKDLRYLNMSSVGYYTPEYWHRFGSIALHWAGARIDPDDPEAAKSYIEHVGKLLGDGYDGIIIDEIGAYAGPGIRKTARMWEGIFQDLRNNHPQMELWIWNSGALRPELAEVYRRAGAIVLLELYEEWFTAAFHTHSFHSYLDLGISAARRADLLNLDGSPHATILCPGVSHYHGGMARDQIEDQVRYIKKQAPEAPGISFYGGDDEWSVALDSLNGFLDELCLKYYIMPVVTVSPHWIWLSDYGPVAGDEITVRTRIHNVGAMEAREVQVRIYARRIATNHRRLISEVALPRIGVGFVTVEPDEPFEATVENRVPPVTWKSVDGIRVPMRGAPAAVRLDRQIVEAKWKPETSGHYRLEVEVTPSTQFTLLEGYAEKLLTVR